MRGVLVAVLLTASAPALADEMTADEIQSELVGRVISWWEADGWFTGDLMLGADGRAQISVDAPKAASDTGRWSIEGNRLCTQWQSLREGSAKCYAVERTEAGRFRTSGGNVFEVRDAGA